MDKPCHFLRLFALFAFTAGCSITAQAQTFTWRFEEIFSNADGTVQFVVIYDQSSNSNNQDKIAGVEFQSVLNSAEHAHDPGYVSSFIFPTNLPSTQTAGRRFLIATGGFAKLNLVKPDFIVEDQFIPQLKGSIALMNGREAIDIAANYPLPNDGIKALFRDGTVKQNIATNFAGQSASVSAGTPTTPPTSTVIEYYNASLDHYFITWATDEIARLDAGTDLRGWTRTGASFKTYTTSQSGTSPVCRYYIPPPLGDSHFFGRGTAECNATGAKNPSFVLESAAFMQMFLPVDGTCPANTTEIYRVYSNRVDANHRYLTDKTMRSAMMAKGWIAEGDGPNLVVMCAPQ